MATLKCKIRRLKAKYSSFVVYLNEKLPLFLKTPHHKYEKINLRLG